MKSELQKCECVCVLSSTPAVTEGVNCLSQVCLLILPAKRKTFTNGGFINLNSLDASLLKIDNLATKGKRELPRLVLSRNVNARERPGEDRHWPHQHTLHWLLGNALGVGALFDYDRARAAYI